MREYISGKWRGCGGKTEYDHYWGYRCYYYHDLIYNSDLQLVNVDQLQDYWLIGRDVEIDLWVQWTFAETEPVRGRSYSFNNGFVVSIENVETGTKGYIFFKASDYGLTERVGDGIIPLKFKPEDMGITEPGRYPIKLEIEAFAWYETEVREYSVWDLYDDYGQPLYPLTIPKANDELSIEKDGDRVEESPYELELREDVWLMVNHVGELTPVVQTIFVTIADSRPTADFTATPQSGIAPLVVSFQNISQSDPYFPITDTRWYFGDGGTSNEPGFDYYVMHQYDKPGNYTVRCIVTNAAGSSEAVGQVTVSAGPLTPLIVRDGSYLPQAITSLDKMFTLTIKVKNNGGAGNIWLRSLCRTTTRELIKSAYIPAYGEITIVTSPNTIAWYCGYTPDIEDPISILLEVGPVGGIVSSNLTWETFVTESDGGEEEEEETGGMSKWLKAGIAGALGIVAVTGIQLVRKK